MNRIITSIQYIVFSLIFLVPVFTIYAKYVFHGIKKSLVYLVFAMYLVALYSLVGLPDILYIRFDFNYNFIPFVGLTDSLEETMLNVLLFVPFGFFLPLLCKKFHGFKHTFFLGLVTTVDIEILQIFTFRATDINDIITNVLGTIIGYFIAMLVTAKFTRLSLNENCVRNVYITLATVFLVMFFMVAFILKALGKY